LDQISTYDLDQINLTNLFNQKKFDAIIHCATDYGRTHSSILSMVETNLVLPLNLLSLAKEKGVGCFINIDTMLPSQVSKYSLSKAHLREWQLMFTTDLNIVNIRMEHFYGPGDDRTKFVTNIVKSLIQNDQEILLTQGSQTRDFIYIDDVLSAFSKIFNHLNSNKQPGFMEFELGSGSVISIKELVEKIKEISGNTSTFLNFGAIPLRSVEATDIRVNLAALEQIGWKLKYDLETGVKKMIEIEREIG
jgi:nucleoside-diphosphate-sugar epimerase